MASLMSQWTGIVENATEMGMQVGECLSQLRPGRRSLSWCFPSFRHQIHHLQEISGAGSWKVYDIRDQNALVFPFFSHVDPSSLGYSEYMRRVLVFPLATILMDYRV